MINDELDIQENKDDLTESMNNDDYRERWEHLEDYAEVEIKDSVRRILSENGSGNKRNRFYSPVHYFYMRGKELKDFNIEWNKQYLKRSYRECRRQYKNFKEKCLEAFYMGYKEIDDKQKRLGIFIC